ncbi:dehydrogenase/reductase SDR family member 4-like [Saccoglossus kowalevskii]|uniref:Dehydrogenase/reductase SDR family member 4-like n=1 Tax=Saccoglossus kowalevskii TaxID=10224 RepID=A0ABM0MPA9_SACKO|nr:PREDICTED: dehydrogenase/reductase SDR family member 4-like [Saccoglossus kowalevskii]
MKMTSAGMKLRGKVAVVTASTDGIGFAIAKRLAEDGASVMISSRKQENVDTALAKLKSENLTKVAGVVCHVGKEDHRNKMIQETLKQFGGIDILVSNAAANPYFGSLLELWKNPALLEMTNENVPMKRIGKPSECAGAVSFLCSDDASFITGETIIMSGGIAPRL